MYSLRLTCCSAEVDLLSAELWEWETTGVRELEGGEGVVLIAGFAENRNRIELLGRFAGYSPEWEQEDNTDWVQFTKDSWPAREVGNRFFLAAVWSSEETPEGRLRIIHNPGLACGTGEHPCTQLALMALEANVEPGSRVLDVGTGSGILAIAARRLGAKTAIGLDTDAAALQAASENCTFNRMEPLLIAGSADCVSDCCADLTVANISGTVLLSLLDDLLRVTAPGGHLILTGFNESELPLFLRLLPNSKVSQLNEWRCIAAKLS